MKNPQTFNRYTYGLNSPYKFTDPLGLAPTQHCFNNICNTYDADERAYNWDTTFGAETARAEAEFDQRLGNTRSVNAANQAITRGDQATANAICASNSNITCNRSGSGTVTVEAVINLPIVAAVSEDTLKKIFGENFEKTVELYKDTAGKYLENVSPY